jgi:glycosyltransferase involved in cell wall biosynthesis
MNVTLDVSAVPRRLAGAGRYVFELARRLPAFGVATTLVTRRDDAIRWRDSSPRSVVAPIVPDNRVVRLVYERWSLGTSSSARSANVWHAPHYTMPHRGSTPTVVTIHDLTFFTNPEWHERAKVTFFRRAIAYAARHASVLISVSAFTARQLDELIPDHAPLVVAPHGVDLVRFTTESDRDGDLLSTHGLSSGVPYVLFVGTLEPRKGVDVLLRAFEEVARGDDRIELWLAGQSGWGLDDIDQSIATHPAATRIRRLGFVDETVLPALLRQSRSVAYPSRGEGFGLPVLEALACGAMVVTSANTVMSDVAGDAAVLVVPGDVEGLARELAAVNAMSDIERSHRSLVARSRAEQFTWESSLAQHLVAYDLASRGH